MKKIVASVRKYIFAHRLSSTNELDNVYYKLLLSEKNTANWLIINII